MAEKYRRGIFFVVYSKNKKGNIEYLILKRKLHWAGWEFPKGGIKKNEDLKKTVKREVKEETGLSILKMKKFDISGEFSYKEKLEDRKGISGQTYEALFAVEVPKKKVKINEEEHSDYQWLQYNQAIKKLTWPNQKKCLKIIDKWLKMKFREIILDSGIQVLLGKDKKQNEELVNLFKGEKNVILHTKSSGSPFCVINNLSPKKKDIKQAAIVCAKYSQDWRNNKNDVIVHYFYGKNISKKKHMALGTFHVKNAKEIKIKKSEIKNFEKKQK